MILGTAAYMAPEQARGRVAIGADVWAFGCVLYDADRRPRVSGNDVTDILAGIIPE
jgi:serine/threonine protein kinase